MSSISIDGRDDLFVYHTPADPESKIMMVTVPKAMRSYWIKTAGQVSKPVFALDRTIQIPVGAIVEPLHEAYGAGEW